MIHKQKFRRNVLAAGVFSALTVGIICASSAEESVLTLDISKQKITKSLVDLTKSSGVQIVLSENISGALQVPEIKGEYSLSSALNVMLSNTGLTYEFISDDTVLIKEVDSKNEVGEKEEVEEVVVTGSRLRNIAPTSPVVIITREDIDRQGLSSAEDVIRSLPQNFSSVNSATSFSEAGRSSDTPYGAEGHSFANLRGLGVNATLVLVNGRRTASSASFDGGRVNLGNIPAAAIERVEVLLDGASAIYGSDALGGVINFILRKNYSGATATVRYEDSANGGHQQSLSQLLGYSWDSGNAQIQLDYSERRSVSAFKAGLNSLDFSPRGGHNWLTENLSRAYGSPGNVSTEDGTHLGALPSGHDGIDWTIDDLSISNVDPYDSAKFGQGGTVHTKTKNVNFTLEQELFFGVSAYMEGSYSKSSNQSTNGTSLAYMRVPTTNPYNKSGESLLVRYIFANEVANGQLDYGQQYNTYTSMGLTAGLRAELFSDWEASAEVIASRTKSENNRDFLNIRADSLFIQAVRGVDSEGNPVPALNPFGSQGKHDAGLDVQSFISKTDAETPDMDLMSFEASANGTLFSITGGDVKMALGMSYRPEELDISNDSRKFIYNTESDTKWKQEATAVFFEGYIPLVSSENSRTGIESLLLTLAGRYDSYEFNGSFGGQENPKSTKSYSHFSPKFGVLWEPVDTLKVRASWSESFRAPGLRVLFEGETDWDYEEEVFDPNTGEYVLLPFFRGGNPDVKPETSVTISGGFDWTPYFLEGLTISPTYTKIDWQDRIGLARPWEPYIRDHINEFPSVFIRDESGALVKVMQKDVNLAQKIAEYVDLSVSYGFDTDWGYISANLTGTMNLKDQEQVFPNSPVLEGIETESGPDKASYNARLSWDNGSYGANIYYRYISGYQNSDTGGEWVYDNGWSFIENPPEGIEHWSTWDLTGYYEFGDGLRINAGVRNLLNNKFPFIDDGNRSYDGSRVDTRGRVVYMEVKKEFEF